MFDVRYSIFVIPNVILLYNIGGIIPYFERKVKEKIKIISATDRHRYLDADCADYAEISTGLQD